MAGLETQLLPGVGDDRGLGVGRPEQLVRVRDGRERADGRRVLAAAEVEVADDGVARAHVAVVGEDGLLGARLPHRALDQHLRAVARVYHRVAHVAEERALE